jgi:hypothetical protein
VTNEDLLGSTKRKLVNILNTECIKKDMEDVFSYQYFISN